MHVVTVTVKFAVRAWLDIDPETMLRISLLRVPNVLILTSTFTRTRLGGCFFGRGCTLGVPRLWAVLPAA